MSLSSVTAEALLDADPEELFVVEARGDASGRPSYRLEFANKALQANTGLYQKVVLVDISQRSDFARWLTGPTHAAQFIFAGHKWCRYPLSSTCVVVRSCSADRQSPSTSRGDAPLLATTEPSIEKKPGDLVTPTEARDLDLKFPNDSSLQSSDVRLGTFLTLMQMSDVGVFEYHLDGTLVHANESWYKLSGHPRSLESHTNFSFMDLVHPDDAPLVMAKWAQLCQGTPITFEMRWKATVENQHRREGPDADAQWILSACFPIVNEHGQVLSIAGNTIDIAAQKLAVFEASRKAEALERARASEYRFARFAELAPVAVSLPALGKCEPRNAMTLIS